MFLENEEQRQIKQDPTIIFYICFLSQECLDQTFSWFHGLNSFPLLPSAQEDDDEEDEGLDESMKETAKEKEERKSDHDVARQDIVMVFLHVLLEFVIYFKFSKDAL